MSVSYLPHVGQFVFCIAVQKWQQSKSPTHMLFLLLDEPLLVKVYQRRCKFFVLLEANVLIALVSGSEWKTNYHRC